MQAEVLISHGHAKLLRPVYLKPDAPTLYLIEIPDNDVSLNRDWFSEESNNPSSVHLPESRPGSLQERYNQLLGKLAKTRAGASIGDDFQTLQDALEERYNGQ